MPTLTRRRGTDPHRKTWHVYYGDVRIGTLGERAGAPYDVDQWGWSCGFYPGSHPGEHLSGTAADLETARSEFEAAWLIFSAKRTDDDYQEWRHQRDFHRAEIFDVGTRRADGVAETGLNDALRLWCQV